MSKRKEVDFFWNLWLKKKTGVLLNFKYLPKVRED
jgi:hypothetical protein